MSDEELYSRQLGLIPPDKLQFPITIIGAGSIGSWLALCLTKMGCKNIEVWDDDQIEPHNIANQAYKLTEDEVFKVSALQSLVNEFTHNTITGIIDKYEGDVLMGELIISAVDNMATRKKIFEGNSGLDKFLIDGRMGGNAIEIYNINLSDEEQCKEYEKTLFDDDRAIPVPCSHRSVAYNGLTIAGMISSVVAKKALGLDIPREIMIDMANYFLLK